MKMEMTVENQKQGLAKLGVTDQRIAELKSKFGNMPEVAINDTAGYKQLVSAIAEVRTDRVAVEHRRKELVEDAVKWQKTVNTEAKRITVELESIEEPLKANKQKIDDEKDRIREAAAQAERDRIKTIQDKIANIKVSALSVIGMSSDDIKHALHLAKSYTIRKDDYQEFYDQAYEANEKTLELLETALDAQLHAEAVAREQEAERVRLAEEQAQLAEQMRAQAQALAKERAALDAQRKAQEEAQAAAQAEIDRQQAQERAKLKAEQEALDAAKREHEVKLLAEQDRQAQIHLEAEAVAKAEKLRLQEEALRPDKEKINAYFQSLVSHVIDGAAGVEAALNSETMQAEFKAQVGSVIKEINRVGGS